MKIKVIGLIILGLIWLSQPEKAYARKKLPAVQTKVTAAPAPAGDMPFSSLKLRADKLALLLKFANLAQAQSITYVLTYNSREVPQGVEGNLDPSIGSTQKELVFGTCSGVVCTYHTGISDMRLQLSIGLKNGKTLTRIYGITL